MKITLDIGDVAFSVPATLPARLPSSEPGGQHAPRLPDYNLPLSAFDSLTLDRLCREFRNEVFRKAGKEQPEQGPTMPAPLTAVFIEKHIGPDEPNREAVVRLVREVEHAHGIR